MQNNKLVRDSWRRSNSVSKNFLSTTALSPLIHNTFFYPILVDGQCKKYQVLVNKFYSRVPYKQLFNNTIHKDTPCRQKCNFHAFVTFEQMVILMIIGNNIESFTLEIIIELVSFISNNTQFLWEKINLHLHNRASAKKIDYSYINATNYQKKS